MSLHTKYRPKTLDDFAGNRMLVDSLQSLLTKDSVDIPHTYLFIGPRGCGKTTLARIFAMMLNCSGFDLKEQNAADFRGIDSSREIVRRMRLKSLDAKGNRGWIIDEVHKWTNDAQNAILKALEEPPEHVFFFLCTTDPQKLLKTIRSRCIIYEVSTLSFKQIIKLLKEITNKEKKHVPGEVLMQIAQDSQGHPREALTILEKVIDLPERQMLRTARQSAAQENKAIDLCKALINGADWNVVKKILSGLQDEEPENIRRYIIAACHNILLKEDNPRAFLVLDTFREPFYNTGKPGLTLACYEALGVE